MATHSSVLAWRIPGTGEPGGLPSMGSHRVGHDSSDLEAAHLKKTKILIQKDKCTPMFTKMYAIVKSLYITPELTLYFSLFNTHTKNLTKILNILSSVCSTYYYFLVFPNASESCAFCITMDPRKEFPLLLKLFHS